ncbi:MAG TPA: HAMP domain-containing protein [Actinoplanes sp.]|nr:HAMP domain-containing protein [Actinoplanes sp.]
MRLRTQLTLVVTALVALVVALAGLVLVVRIDHRDRDELDRVLAARAAQVSAAATKNGSLPTDGSFAIRLIDDGDLLKQIGSSAGFPLPARDGYSTVSSGDDEWRSLAQTLVTGAQLQILVSLDDLEEQHTDNVLIVDLLVLLAALLSAAGVWFATGLVLRPFQRLLTAARELDAADPDQRLPEVKSPREMAELTSALNDLLVRARSEKPYSPEPEPEPEPEHEAEHEAEPVVQPEPVPAPAHNPAADLRPSLAELGAQLDQLLDNPDMPATQRHLILAVMADDHRRMVALVDGDG